ncbi:protein-methionine-sulfoxide reductase heme-binding subunit MsrQ [Neptunicella marina]|uniref:Protein-methionine-sulfoxide reductase heme-binding subunit MsrQ n=1 Tax=Neptunicella marina TaxID=2125989 RepID=A0A8J6LYH5_9ALTE|nr:protein-methionine-sulfoxide reductase heme-binding subunit MsrQ [Neptunicella marina]MBC3765365.1 protein-methionine-sulfoxide reductase heme-binding subunit MsrQ [Neptunicella marina]
MTQNQKVFTLKTFIHLAALTPVIWLYLSAFSDGLGADPVQYVIHFTGKGALNLLLITLCVSPLAQKFKQGWLMQVRRLLGLYSFFYAVLHLANFILFDLQNNWSLFINEVIKRPYITIGMVALLLLTALSVTSFNALRRKMGRNWQKLHNWVYVILLLVCVHYIWSVKANISQPLIYFMLAFVLLALRYKKFSRILPSSR